MMNFAIIIVCTAAMLVSCSPSEGKKLENIAELIEHLELIEPNEELVYFILYTHYCRGCPSSAPLEHANRLPEGVSSKIIAVFHPSYKAHDFQNLRTNEGVQIKMVSAPEKLAPLWDKICPLPTMDSCNGIILMRKKNREHGFNFSALSSGSPQFDHLSLRRD